MLCLTTAQGPGQGQFLHLKPKAVPSQAIWCIACCLFAVSPQHKVLGKAISWSTRMAPTGEWYYALHADSLSHHCTRYWTRAFLLPAFLQHLSICICMFIDCISKISISSEVFDGSETSQTAIALITSVCEIPVLDFFEMKFSRCQGFKIILQTKPFPTYKHTITLLLWRYLQTKLAKATKIGDSKKDIDKMMIFNSESYVITFCKQSVFKIWWFYFDGRFDEAVHSPC